MMKQFFTLLFLIASVGSYAQVSINTGVINRYNKEEADLAPDFKTKEQLQNRLEIEKKGDVGFCIFTLFKIDTLNKSDFLTGSHFAYPGLVMYDGTKDITHALVMSMGYNDKDTLKVNLPIILPSFFPNIYAKIINDKITTRIEYMFTDTSARLTPNKVRSDNFIPVKVSKITLSTSNFAIGNTIYGEADMITDPFYVDNGGFKTGYIYQQIHLKFVFKLPIIKKPF